MTSLNQAVNGNELPDKLGPLPRGMQITGVGGYVPEKVVTNAEVAMSMSALADSTENFPSDLLINTITDDDWIQKRTHIVDRRYAAPDQATSDLAVEAIKIALETAGRSIDMIDFIICATVTPDYLYSPATAAVILNKLLSRREGLEPCVGLDHIEHPQKINRSIFTCDVASACTSFGAALELAYFLIKGGHRSGIVVGADIMESISNPYDRATHILFGSGAGAFVVEAVPVEQDAFRNEWFDAGTAAEYCLKIIGKYGGTANPLTVAMMDKFAREPWDRSDKIWQDGNFVYTFMTQFLPKVYLPHVCDKAGISWDSVRHVFAHQANGRLNKKALDGYKNNFAVYPTLYPIIHSTIESYANTTSASIPLGLYTVLTSDWERMIQAAETDEQPELMLNNDDLMQLIAFGGGITWTNCFLRWKGVLSMPLSYQDRYEQALLKEAAA
ncbi:MAG: ketoacyl-ACP synthase III [Patescibacteria group bacterium]